MEFLCLHIFTLDEGNCLHNEYMFTLCLCCVHIDGGILSLWTLLFLCSTSTKSPIPLGVHGLVIGCVSKSCFLWAYSLLWILHQHFYSLSPWPLMLLISGRPLKSGEWQLLEVELFCLPGSCGAMQILYCAVILFWVQGHTTSSFTIEVHRFSDRSASFSWCPQGLVKGLSLTAYIRTGPGANPRGRAYAGPQSAFVCWVRGVAFGPCFHAFACYLTVSCFFPRMLFAPLC